MEISTKGWVGGSGGGQFPLKKIKKHAFKIHFRPFWAILDQLFFHPYREGGSGQALSQAALDKVNVKLTAKITTHPPPNANQSWPPTNPLHCHQPPVTATHYQSTPPTMTHWIWEVRNFQGEKVQKKFLVPNELKSPKNNTSFYFFFH